MDMIPRIMPNTRMGQYIHQISLNSVLYSSTFVIDELACMSLVHGSNEIATANLIPPETEQLRYSRIQYHSSRYYVVDSMEL